MSQVERLYSGVGSPEGIVATGPGDIYVASDGTIYLKSQGSGATGWVLLPSAGGATTNTIASGTAVLGTSAIGSGGASAVVTVAAAGVLATDNVMADFNADPTGVTGYAPSPNGMLTIVKFCSPGHVNFYAVNNTGLSITPGPITLNWRVVR